MRAQIPAALLISAITVVSAALSVLNVANAQPYPSKPIRFIVPFAPGGGTDIIGRIAARKLTEALKNPVVVDNRPGAGGTVGAELGAKSPPDGHTFTVIVSSYAANASLYKLGFDPANDVTPIIQFSQGPFLVVVHPSLPVKNIRELVALARSEPGGLSYASSGQGSGVHLATELFLFMAGIKAVHVPYRGTGPALIDTMAGQTQFLFGNTAATLPLVKSGRLRAIAVTSARRAASLPDVPAIAESGVTGYDVTVWHGLIGPKGVARSIVERINGELNRALKAGDMVNKLASDGLSVAGGTPDQFREIIRRDIEIWRRVLQRTGIKAE